MQRSTTRLLVAVAATLSLGGLALPAAASAGDPVDPTTEAQNFAITQQRQAIYDTPAYQTELTTVGTQEGLNATAAEAKDPERFFSNNLCWNHYNGCAGDVRLYHWGTNGYGLVKPVLFTARNGATLSGHVWATRSGPAKRPGVVITNGSVQADEQMYWYAAQALAKAGYVVLTFDPQGQGQSDTLGEGADANEGVPAQSDGRPFYDGTEDALDFFLSSSKHPYKPVTSCSTGTSHAAKQTRRVKAGLDTGYNPFASMLNTSQIGLAGHSYGAAGVSYIAQWDKRVKAVVAWDNLGGPGPSEGSVPGSSNTQTIGEQGCPAHPADRKVVPITKPGLGISADYGLPPTPNVTVPDPGAKSVWSKAYTKAGVDSGQIIIRGGSHLDFSFIPNQAFGSFVARAGPHRLVHHRVVRQVRQAPELGRRAVAHHPLAARRCGSQGRSDRRRQCLLVLLPVQACDPPVQRRQGVVREPARRVHRPDGQGRLQGSVLLPRSRHLTRPLSERAGITRRSWRATRGPSDR